MCLYSDEQLNLLIGYSPSFLIGIFTHLKLCLSDAIHNYFKWVKIIPIWQNRE